MPYAARPRRSTHPDTLAVTGRLAGLNVVPIQKCRFLEVGCGTGGNLIPMAATMPDSQFVGIDISPVQIKLARAEAEALGLTNLRFETQDLADMDPALGLFDYIVAHGVYSWVPPAVQDGLLALYQSRLTPMGVGYISYNTYPGWHFRGIARQAMLDRVAGIPGDPATKTRVAREYIRFLATAAPDPDMPYSHVLQSEADLIGSESDHYVFHDYLEDDNRPVLFREFAAHAGRHQLKYIGEVLPFPFLGGLTEELTKLLREMSSDLVDLEQHVDFIRNRSFRRTLLCHAGAATDPKAALGVIPGLLVSASARPALPDSEADPEAAQDFIANDGMSISTRNPIVTAMLRAIFTAWPAAVPVSRLEQLVADRIGSAWTKDPERARRLLHQQLLDQYRNGMLTLNTHMPDFALTIPERPVAFAPARRAAATGTMVPTIRHFQQPLEPMDQFILTRLDGTNDRAALTTALASAVAAGTLEARPEGDPPAWVDLTLQRLAYTTLLEGK
jgi:methyltransferase-like protein